MLRLFRPTHACPGFGRLELKAGPDEIRLDRGRYRGARPEIIEAFFREHLAPAKVEVIAGGVPRTRSELEYRVLALDRQLQLDKRGLRMFWAMFLPFVVGFLWLSTVMALFFASIVLLVGFLIRGRIKSMQQERRELERYRQEATGHPSFPT